VNNAVVTELFETAARNKPGLIILKDPDRALQHLLNRLDGVSPYEGVIVTANKPASLDPAILKRPGRFCRIVSFPDPDAACRRAYLLKLPRSTAENKSLETLIRETEGS
jgi:ATP-dependent 26S proteasome regulatory subunit